MYTKTKHMEIVGAGLLTCWHPVMRATCQSIKG